MKPESWSWLALLAVLLVPSSRAQADGQATADPPAAKPWGWSDPDRKPFHPWHTDPAIQERLLSEAKASTQEIVGITLEAPVEIVIVPGWAFFFATMETGAKDGSLFLHLRRLCVPPSGPSSSRLPAARKPSV